MRVPLVLLPVVLATALAALAPMAAATTVSGTLGPQYGLPLAVQASQSDVGGGGEPTAPSNTNADSQLDAAYGYVADGTLYLFFSGNLTFWLQLEGKITHWLPLDVYVDCSAGGQHQLVANNPAPDSPFYDLGHAAGLTFDAGFAPDYWLSLGGRDLQPGWPSMNAYFATLPAGGGGSGAYLGSTLPGAPGVLSGGSNPGGIQVAFDVDNRAGLGSGCGAAASPVVSTGIEWAIPLSAIGNPTGCIRVCALVASQDHFMISNQVLGPIPPGTCAMASAAETDFSSVSGDQFFTVCQAATPTLRGTWGTLKALYR